MIKLILIWQILGLTWTVCAFAVSDHEDKTEICREYVDQGCEKAHHDAIVQTQGEITELEIAVRAELAKIDASQVEETQIRRRIQDSSETTNAYTVELDFLENADFAPLPATDHYSPEAALADWVTKDELDNVLISWLGQKSETLHWQMGARDDYKAQVVAIKDASSYATKIIETELQRVQEACIPFRQKQLELQRQIQNLDSSIASVRGESCVHTRCSKY